MNILWPMKCLLKQFHTEQIKAEEKGKKKKQNIFYFYDIDLFTNQKLKTNKRTNEK